MEVGRSVTPDSQFLYTGSGNSPRNLCLISFCFDSNNLIMTLFWRILSFNKALSACFRILLALYPFTHYDRRRLFGVILWLKQHRLNRRWFLYLAIFRDVLSKFLTEFRQSLPKFCRIY